MTIKTAAVFVPSPGHAYPGHPEEPGRLDQVKVQDDLVSLLSPVPATVEDITRVHTSEMVRNLKMICEHEPGIIDYAPTFVTSSSYQDALLAAGGTLASSRAVIAGKAKNAFAIVRPPGHHAEPDSAMGFCIFNNIAVAAQDAVQNVGLRVAIVDYDAHHGNGTQAYAWKNEKVAYFSTHQEFIYPGSGTIEDAPHARKRIVNVPLPAHTGVVGFSHITTQLIEPFIRNFKPDMIMVSAGFDSHWNDPLTSLGMTTGGFFLLSRWLVELAGEVCHGKILFVLEGGYHPRNVARGVDAVFAALTGKTDVAETTNLSPYREPAIDERIGRIRVWHGFRG